MISFQKLPRDAHLTMAAEVAREPSTATAYLPSMRAWGSTSHYFRELVYTEWLAPAKVCEFKLSRAMAFDCPALRVLDVAEHFAPVLSTAAFMKSVKEAPKRPACPDNSGLPLMLLNRAGEHLPSETRAELTSVASNSEYYALVNQGQNREADNERHDTLVCFIRDCFGVEDPGDDELVPIHGERHFAEDCFNVLYNLPAEFKALGLHELTRCLVALTKVPDEKASNAILQIRFEIDNLIPVQWQAHLTSNAIFSDMKFEDCVRVVLNDARVAGFGAGSLLGRVVRLVASFVDGLPAGQRHWTTLAAVKAGFWEIDCIKHLLRTVHEHLRKGPSRDLYRTELVRCGLLTKQELRNTTALRLFKNWCSQVDNGFGERMSSMLF